MTAVSFNHDAQAFYIIYKDEIDLDRFTAGRRLFANMLCCFAHMMKTFTIGIGHGFQLDIELFIQRSGLQRFIDEGNGGVIASPGFKPV